MSGSRRLFKNLPPWPSNCKAWQVKGFDFLGGRTLIVEIFANRNHGSVPEAFQRGDFSEWSQKMIDEGFDDTDAAMRYIAEQQANGVFYCNAPKAIQRGMRHPGDRIMGRIL